MTTHNKQSVLTNEEILAIGSFAQSPLTRIEHARAIEQAVLSKLRGAGEPIYQEATTDELGEEVWFDITAEQAIKDAKLFRVRTLYAAPQASAEVRNAALEEAAKACEALPYENFVLKECISVIRKLKSASAAEVRCQYCDGTGDVHSPDGEWRGKCNCGDSTKEDAPRLTTVRFIDGGLVQMDRSDYDVLMSAHTPAADRQQRGGDAEGLLDRLAEAIESGDYGSQIKYLSDIRVALSTHKPVEGDAKDAEFDPLQGAANWLAKALTTFNPTVLSGCLMIGYNRAKRLYDAAIVQQGQESANG